MNGYFLQVIAGLWVTLTLAAVSLSLGIILGILGAVGMRARRGFIKTFTNVITSVIRALPELLILFFIYFGSASIINDVFGHYVNVSPFIAGAIALSIVFGAYATQVFHGALLAVHHGQIEAASALGFSDRQIFFRIYFPQAWRHALPGLGNLWVTLVKDTSIVTLIGLSDVMNATKLAAAATGEPFNWYILVAIIYLVVTSSSEWLLKRYTRTSEYHAC